MNENIGMDPELRDDLAEIADNFPDVDLPDFDETDFVLPEDFEDGEDD